MFKKIKQVTMIIALVAAFSSHNERNVSAESISSANLEVPVLKSVCTTSAKCSLVILDGAAKLSGSVIGKLGTSQISSKLMLQRYETQQKKWISVKVWSTTSKSSRSSLTKTYSLSKKGKYRCKLSADVVCNGKKEALALTSQSKQY